MLISNSVWSWSGGAWGEDDGEFGGGGGGWWVGGAGVEDGDLGGGAALEGARAGDKDEAEEDGAADGAGDAVEGICEFGEGGGVGLGRDGCGRRVARGGGGAGLGDEEAGEFVAKVDQVVEDGAVVVCGGRHGRCRPEWRGGAT